MNIEFIWKYCNSKIGAQESFPFNSTTLVFKVGGKIFALFDIENFKGINLKCNPVKSIDLRESYSGIIPAFHMNKKHWNTVKVNEDVSQDLLIELINHSYDLVYSSLPKELRDGI